MRCSEQWSAGTLRDEDVDKPAWLIADFQQGTDWRLVGVAPV